MNVEPWLAAAVVVAALLVVKRLILGGKMSSSVVKQKLEQGARIVDVRTPEEFRDGAYPGAVNIPLQELARRLGELSREVPVVLYCASGARSGLAARAMKQAGFADVVNAGGLDDMPR
jgi:phage shock protein E